LLKYSDRIPQRLKCLWGILLLKQKTVVIFVICDTIYKSMSRVAYDDNLGGISMAENKQYITQKRENGSVMISEDVIAAIVAHAVCDVEGVAGLAVKPGADIVELIGKKNWGKGLKIVVGQDETLSIDCNVTVKYGQSVVDVAKAVQDAVTVALESMAGVTIASVNVNVCGIIR